MKKEKTKDNSLSKPTLFRRVWKVWLYNIIFTALFFWLFLGNYTIDDVAFELDYYFMYGFSDLRWQLFTVIIAFWFFFRQIFKLLNLVKFTVLTARHDNEVVEHGGHKRMYEGEEGLGKTINTANDTLLIACENDRSLRLAYYLKYPYSAALQNDPDFKILRESFEYFEKNGHYLPHVMANFKIIYEGRKNYPFSMEYLDQTKRLAEGFACGLTELGNILPNSWSRIPADEEKDKKNNNLRTKNETLSLSRQFFDLTIIADEQRTGEVFLGFRSVVSNNKRITARKKVLKPYFLMRIHSWLENRVLSRKTRTTRFLSAFYTKLGLLIEDIGFYVFTYEVREAREGKVEEKDLSFVISCDVPFEFDTRGERFKYKLYSNSPE